MNCFVLYEISNGQRRKDHAHQMCALQSMHFVPFTLIQGMNDEVKPSIH